MECDPDLISCQLDHIDASIRSVDVWATYVIPVAGIFVTLLLGVSALTATRAANRIARQNVEILRRDDRRRVGAAVRAYYETRREDIRNGTNGNMPHWTDEVEAVATEVDAPNWESLLSWLTESIDHLLNDGPREDLGINATHFYATVPVVIGRWVNDPAAFAEPVFRLWHERRKDVSAGG